ncbi:hypothetical protein GUJ93_ZPchr0006g45024 [Zizania palustris]|uniref:Uncharacterized protein n=1 Tax=Zizania palustris TaxID=103762 RepID=A0A8J5VJ22_ZIZPA|nr:hypothetical protein GUJ93_ZPchr0006g45024 [Zizania palustris]
MREFQDTTSLRGIPSNTSRAASTLTALRCSTIISLFPDTAGTTQEQNSRSNDVGRRAAQRECATRPILPFPAAVRRLSNCSFGDRGLVQRTADLRAPWAGPEEYEPNS